VSSNETIGSRYNGPRLNLFRGYALLASVFIISLYAFGRDSDYDPIGLRLIPSGAFFLAFLSSYFSPFVRRSIQTVLQLCLFVTNCWLAWLIHRNQFGAIFVGGYSIVSFAGMLVFQDRWRMLAYSVLSIGLLAWTSVGMENAQFDVPTAIALNVGAGLASFLAIHYRQLGQNQLRQGLDKSEVIQDVALDSSRDALLLVNEKGDLIKGNAAFQKLWEVPVRWIRENRQEEVVRQCMGRLKEPDLLRKYVLDEETILAEGDTVELELLDERSLEIYWMRLQVQDQYIGRLWIFRDISSRKRLQTDLIASERRLRRNNEMLMEFAGSHALINGEMDTAFEDIARVSAEMLDVETVSIWIFEDKFRTMVCRKLYRRSNDSFESGIRVPLNGHVPYLRALEKSRALVVRDTREDPVTGAFYQGSYTGRAAALIHAQIRSAGKMVGMFSLESDNGPRVWSVEDQTYAHSMADLVTVSIESWERRKAQQQLRNSIAILQAIFDLSETGIIVEDNENNVLNYNELYLKIWNMTRDFVENAPYEEQIAYCKSQTLNATTYSEGLARLRARPDMEYAGIIEFKDGKFIERYSKAISMGGEIKGRVWFYLDITERKQKETELINRNFELDSFVYRASHDLKAPLNSIMGLISIIREEKEVDKILTFISMMDKSVKKLDEFIKQLTQFSQDARLKVVRQAIDLHEFVEDVLRDLRFMESAERVDIRVEVNQEGEFFSDPVRLGIVFNNLISNAIKYQDPGKSLPTLQIRIDSDSRQAVCRFIDNGLGIDKEHLEKVFDLFFRASVQATGSGLGLYITHNAIQKMNGNIAVESEFGKGTTFILTIPNQSSEPE
jgi:signal transduction histidine kinase